MASEHFKCTKQKCKLALTKGIMAVVFICLSLTLIYNFQIIPALIPFAKANISTEITKTMQSVVKNCIESGGYTDFVRLSYSTDGNVTALETNYESIALINSRLTESATKILCDNDLLTVRIPLGTLSGGAILAGKGPDIKIKVKISPKITTAIENEFYESGINQTLHRIVAKINVKTYALLPMSTREIEVPTEICLAETVIVGKVPDAYTKINRHDNELEESDIDDIYDFGATLN